MLFFFEFGFQTKAKILTNDQLHDLEHLWQQWDIDGNGVVDKKEFTRGLIKLGLDPQKTDAIYTAVDTNCNGTISQDEFAAWYCTDKVIQFVDVKIATTTSAASLLFACNTVAFHGKPNSLE